MKFDDLDTQMRIYETSVNLCVLPDIYMATRLDGRNFTNLTKNKSNFDVPFD